jgi:hypothetical protein
LLILGLLPLINACQPERSTPTSSQIAASGSGSEPVSTLTDPKAVSNKDDRDRDIDPECIVTIPINQIWGYWIPGTRGNLIGEILGFPAPWHRPLYYMGLPIPSGFPKHENMAPGFAVIGQGVDALAAAHNVLVNQEPISKVFSENADLSLVFFAREDSWGVVIECVARNGKEIDIVYHREPHRTPVSGGSQFALIPIGRLPAGEYKVRCRPGQMPKPLSDLGFEDTYLHNATDWRICQPFQFRVTASANPSTAGQGSGFSRIEADQIWGYSMLNTRDVSILDSLETRLDEDGRRVGLLREGIIATIRRALYRPPIEKRNRPGPGFVVAGTDLAAARAIQKVITGDQPPRNAFTEGEELSCMFFSHTLSGCLRLIEVIRHRNDIRVTYQFLPHPSDADASFAIIPLGRLKAGDYAVKFSRRPTDAKLLVGPGEQDKDERAIGAMCQPFNFTVTAKNGD